MDDLTPTPSPLLKVFAFIVRWSLGLLLLAWFLVAVGWGALHLFIVPRIGELRPQLESSASRALGVTVRIEEISAYSTGMIPAFELVNVRPTLMSFDVKTREYGRPTSKEKLGEESRNAYAAMRNAIKEMPPEEFGKAQYHEISADKWLSKMVSDPKVLDSFRRFQPAFDDQ